MKNNSNLFICAIAVFLLILATDSRAGIGVNLPKKIALIISISDYPDEGGWVDISCYNDKEFIIKGLKYKGFKEENIHLLLDSTATKKGIINRLQYIASITKPGDNVFVHYSGHGQQLADDNMDESDEYDEAIVPWDAQMRWSESYQGEKHIRDDELMDLLNNIRNKSGPGGQVVFSVDACHSGPEKEEASINDQPIYTRGGFLEINPSEETSSSLAPFIFISATVAEELSYEYTLKEEGIALGSYSYAFYLSLLNSNDSTSFNTLYSQIKSIMNEISPSQHPAVVGNMDEIVFEGKGGFGDSEYKFVIQNGDLYILSIGIDKYYFQENLWFENCSKDALLFSSFVSDQYNLIKPTCSEIITYTLVNEKASKESIIDHINLIINESKPEDYFVFSFAGFSNKEYDSITEQSSIDFFAYCDSHKIEDQKNHEVISLHQLKDLMEFVPAHNQLFITESGNTKDFQRDFTKALIESNPDINKFRKRNRVIVCPVEVGYDSFNCDEKKIKGGPLVHFLTTLPEDINFFYLFGRNEITDKVVHQVNKKQIECKLLNRTYTSFFFEREYIKRIEFLFPNVFAKSRGTSTLYSPESSLIKKVGTKHALVIGINDYSKGKPLWTDLTNPTYDASEIAKELENNYGYDVKLLLDSESDLILEQLRTYADILNKSDQLFIFIAGHGDFDSLFFNDGFLVTSSSQSTDEDPFRKSYISFSKFENIINNLPPKQIFICLDVCFGGAFDDQVKKFKNRKRDDIYNDLGTDEFVKNKIELTTRLYMTSGSLNEVPDGYAGNHSPFAYKLLEALRTYGADEGYITSNQLFNFVEKLPSKPLLGSFGDDEPGSVFVFLPNKEEIRKK